MEKFDFVKNYVRFINRYNFPAMFKFTDTVLNLFFIILVLKVFETDRETHFMYCIFCDFSENIYNKKN